LSLTDFSQAPAGKGDRHTGMGLAIVFATSDLLSLTKDEINNALFASSVDGD
jgi:hypothetical protein